MFGEPQPLASAEIAVKALAIELTQNVPPRSAQMRIEWSGISVVIVMAMKSAKAGCENAFYLLLPISSPLERHHRS